MSTSSIIQAAIDSAVAAATEIDVNTIEVDEIERIAADARFAIEGARAVVLAEFGTQGGVLYGKLGELAYWLQEVARRAIENGQTIDTTTTLSTMPATVLAMRLFGDPQRGADIVRLNKPSDPNRLAPGLWRVPRE